MSSATFATPLGPCTIRWEENRLTGFRLLENSAPTDDPPPEWIQAIVRRVQQHLAGDLQDFAGLPYEFAPLPAFRRAVYEAALGVKAGSTQTYGWLARQIGQPVSASRAVGTALGQNPWPLLVPCHRFVGANGRLTGFSAPGGVTTKQRLLAIERVELFAL